MIRCRVALCWIKKQQQRFIPPPDSVIHCSLLLLYLWEASFLLGGGGHRNALAFSRYQRLGRGGGGIRRRTGHQSPLSWLYVLSRADSPPPPWRNSKLDSLCSLSNTNTLLQRRLFSIPRPRQQQNLHHEPSPVHVSRSDARNLYVRCALLSLSLSLRKGIHEIQIFALLCSLPEQNRTAVYIGEKNV